MLAGLYGGGMMMAQNGNGSEKRAWFTESQYVSTSVNNKGQAVIFVNQNEPYEIWTPQTGEIKTIGGISAGNNIGGVGSFTDDGKTVSAVMFSDDISVPASWVKTQFDDLGYDFKNLSRSTNSGVNMFAIGSSSDGQAGFLMRSTNNGKTWRKPSAAINYTGEPTVTDIWKGGLECIGWFSPEGFNGFVGGHNGYLFHTPNGGTQWDQVDPHPAGNTDVVSTYWAVDFIPVEENYLYKYGVLGLELEDGTGAVWYTTDAVESFNVATGVGGVPVSITHVGGTYYMATRNGLIQKSEDYGKTWTTVFTAGTSVNPFADDAPLLNRIKFADEANGMALGLGYIYVTTDGGETWTRLSVTEGTEDIAWNDVSFHNGTATVVGDAGNAFETSDMGLTWKRITVEDGNGIDFMSVLVEDDASNVSGTDATFFNLGASDAVAGYTAALYDVETEQWSPLPGTGYFSGESASSAYNISGDGSTVVGGVYSYEQLNAGSSVICEGAAWVDGELVRLGSKFAENNRSSQARAVSYDGSVVVGWQDHHGPWHASVWRKNASGGYDQSFIFKDPDMTEDDLDMSFTQEGITAMNSNLLGQANAVSSDGKIIGGRGEKTSYAVNGPWLWSEEKGLQLLYDEPGADYMVYDMTNDGSFVVGQVGAGASSFIWTEETGLVEANEYVTDILGIDMQGYYICGIYDLSPNGRYITGWCMKGQGKFAYVLDLKGDIPTSIEKDVEQTKAAVYPNPVSNELHVDMPFSDVKTHISLYSLQGACIRSMTTTDVNNVMDVTDIPDGLYILDVNANGTHKSFKITVKH